MTNAISNRQATFSPELIDELHGYARRLAGNDSDAWDLVQDTLERALRKWPSGITREAAGPWFRVVLKNRHLDIVRSSGRRTAARTPPEVMEQIPAPEPSDLPLWRRVDPEVVKRALPLLCAEQRQVLIMQWHESRSLRDIAAILGVPQATVGVRAHRARKTLRRLLLDEPRFAAREARPAARAPERTAPRSAVRSASQTPATRLPVFTPSAPRDGLFRRAAGGSAAAAR